MELFYSLRSPYRKKAVWVLNDSTVKALRKLKDNTGNYIWNPSVQAGVPDTILNRPYKTSSYVPEIKAGNKCMLLPQPEAPNSPNTSFCAVNFTFNRKSPHFFSKSTYKAIISFHRLSAPDNPSSNSSGKW